MTPNLIQYKTTDGKFHKKQNYDGIGEEIFDLSNNFLWEIMSHPESEGRLVCVHYYNKILYLLYGDGIIYESNLSDPYKFTAKHKFDSDLAHVVPCGELILFKRERKTKVKYSHAIFNCKTKEFRDINLELEYNCRENRGSEVYLGNFRRGKILVVDLYYRKQHPPIKADGIQEMCFYGDFLVIISIKTLSIHQRNGKMIRSMKLAEGTKLSLFDMCIMIDGQIYCIIPDSITFMYPFLMKMGFNDVNFSHK